MAASLSIETYHHWLLSEAQMEKDQDYKNFSIDELMFLNLSFNVYL